MKLTLPTILTLFRIVLIPVLVVAFYLPYRWSNFVAALIFTVCAVTDWADGWIARRYRLTSAFGAFLDPVADKLAVAVALFIVVQSHPTVWLALMSAIIVGREITISALREWMAEVGERRKVRVAAVGKIKTIVQMVAIVCLVYRDDILGLPVFAIGEWLLGVAAALTLWSGLGYLRAAWPAFKADAGEGGDTPAADREDGENS